MDRRSLFGLFAGAATVAAASKVCAADTAVVPIAGAPTGFAVGEVREFFSHMQSSPLMDVSHTHSFSYPDHFHNHSSAVRAVPVTKPMRWDGQSWVDIV